MTLEEAIEIKCRTGNELLNTDPDEIKWADQLSIEALKEISRLRKAYIFSGWEPLPGETKG